MTCRTWYTIRKFFSFLEYELMKARHNLSLNITVIIILPCLYSAVRCPGEGEQGKVTETSHIRQGTSMPIILLTSFNMSICTFLIELRGWQRIPAKCQWSFLKKWKVKSVNQIEDIQINTRAEEEEEKFKFRSGTMTFPVKTTCSKFTEGEDHQCLVVTTLNTQKKPDWGWELSQFAAL